MTALAALGRDLVEALADRARALDAALHTVQVSVDGRTVAQATNDPLGLDTPQRMYSVSKTVTGLAVGILADEGAVGLDDPIARHFPEMAPVHPWLEATTIRHMLSMRGPHRSTTYTKTEGGWLESYFRVTPTHPPGALFTYDTSASYVLAALVERLTGASLVEYLRPRLLDPLGMSPGLRFLTGPEKIAHGGSGLICTPRDLLRLAHLLLDDGVHDGARLLPRGYLREAARAQADTATQTWGASLRRGYGYQLWIPRPGCWLMFGLGGQIVLGDPARRIAVVVTADTQACSSGDQRLLDDVLELLVHPLAEQVDAARATGTDVTGPPSEVALAWPTPAHDPAHARTVAGRYVALTDGPGPAELVFALDARGGRLSSAGAWSAVHGWDVELGFDAPRTTRAGADPAVVTAGWTSPGTLDVRGAVHGEDLATWHARLAWAPDGTLAVQSQVFCESADPAWTFHGAYRPV